MTNDQIEELKIQMAVISERTNNIKDVVGRLEISIEQLKISVVEQRTKSKIVTTVSTLLFSGFISAVVAIGTKLWN